MTEQQSDKPGRAQRLEISLDGSYACALWGKDLHDGEAVFVEIEGWPNATHKQEQAAMREAYETLCKAIGERLPFDIVREHSTATVPELQPRGECHDAAERDEGCFRALKAERELAEAKAQLPDGMKDCTILFKQCDKGHGWLTATNWVQHGCPTCELDSALSARGPSEDHRILEAAYESLKARMVGAETYICELERNAATRSTKLAFTHEDAAKIVERKSQALADDPHNGYVEGDTNAFIWTNKEAEWQSILLDELAEEFRAAIVPSASGALPK